MHDRLDRFSRLMGQLVPDAVTASVVLLLLLFGMAFWLGDTAAATTDAYYRGLWMLLPFTMQMTLIITLSAVLGATPVFRRSIVALSEWPRTANQVVMLAVALSAFLSYLYWGLGMALTPLVAIHFARQAEARGLKIDFLFFLALIWAANSCWQYGLSASAPLLIATPGHFLEKMIGVVPLSRTIWSPAAIVQTLAFPAVLMVVGCALMPKTVRPVSQFPEALKATDEPEPDAEPAGFSERLEHSPIVTLALTAILGLWLYTHFFTKKLGLDINSLNTILLSSCLLLQGSVHRFMKALERAVRSAWPVIVLYHLYAGVAGLIQFTSVGEFVASAVAGVSTPYTFPLLTALSGAAVSIFVPSSGGQWAIQGYVTSKAALAVGVTVERGMLALSVGDHMGNLTAPFWYMVIAGIARVNFREFFGYGLVFAALWFALGVAVFTFLPC
ncbi:MAG: TIGR00366 family protein [Bryobacteraceae bacterium]